MASHSRKWYSSSRLWSSWKWHQEAWFVSTKLYGTKSQKTAILIFNAVRTSNLTQVSSVLKYNDPYAKCSLHFFFLQRIKFRFFWNSTCETCVVKVDTLSVAVDNNEVTPQPPHPPQLPSASVSCWERETTVLYVIQWSMQYKSPITVHILQRICDGQSLSWKNSFWG